MKIARHAAGALGVGVLAMGLGTSPVGAVTYGFTENPYGVITNRNAFGIRPPPPEPEPAPPPPPPTVPPNVFLTGITHERGVRKAFFVIQRNGAKTPDYESIVEGDEIQDFKVQEIFPKEGKVRVLISGREVVLNFADNGMKSSAPAGPPPGPGRPGAPGMAPVPQPTAATGPVVIGRGGNRAEASGAVANPVVYAGATGDQEGGVPVQMPTQMPAMDRIQTTTPRTLPARALGSGIESVETGQPTSAENGGAVPIPVPPPSRFAP
ncbi:MAG: hypothetical protein KIT22_13195 [Verrucomicrobiae bacterium]|nr:hypothetical protein [Verrucomicrobiae bacterium]